MIPILLILGALYVIIGVIINCRMMEAMLDVPKGHIHYNQAQEVVSNLKNFICFSLSIFRWPGLIRTIYFGGNNGI